MESLGSRIGISRQAECPPAKGKSAESDAGKIERPLAAAAGSFFRGYLLVRGSACFYNPSNTASDAVVL
jgi:hypothetical protein